MQAPAMFVVYVSCCVFALLCSYYVLVKAEIFFENDSVMTYLSL